MYTFTHKNWWLYALSGVLLILLGIFMLLSPLEAALGLAFYFGLVITVRGMFLIVNALQNWRTNPGWGWILALGILDCLFGIILFSHPLITALLLPVFFGFWAVFAGAVKGVSVYRFRTLGIRQWGWGIAASLLSVLLGLLLVTNPLEGTLALTLLIGLHLIVFGAATLWLSFQFRQARPEARQSVVRTKKEPSPSTQEIPVQ